MEDKKEHSVRNLLIIISVLLVVVVSISLHFNITNLRKQYDQLSLFVARSLFQELVVTRRWNAMHGGVYMPLTKEVQPNPYLDDPLRDIITTDGMRLTKVNPAYMTRMLGGLIEEEKGVDLHITSLNPLRPENMPDKWEERALREFKNGSIEEFDIIGDGESAVFRYMAPLKIEQPCLKCHGKQGYKTGDISGGISVSLPYASFQVALHTHSKQMYLLHFVFLCISLAFIYFLGRKLILRIKELREASLHIKRLEGILPICSHCKRIRIEGKKSTDASAWMPVEGYVTDRTDARFSHGICPECYKEYYSDIENE